jgi:hypothetical protein
MGQFQPGTTDELIRLFEDVAPQLKGSNGFVSM